MVLVVSGIVLTIAGVFIASYVSSAKQIADKTTLRTLNDALNRYKNEGGSLAALTAEANPLHVINLLKTPVSWWGLNHIFLNQAFTCSASSLAAQGEGKSFRFYRYKSYDALAKGDDTEYVPPPPPPPYFRGYASPLYVGYASWTNVYTLTGSVPAGDLAILIFAYRTSVGGGKITSVTDSKGNVWTIDSHVQNTNSLPATTILSSPITHALAPGDTITSNGGVAYTHITGALVSIANPTASDQPNASGTYAFTGTGVSVSAEATVAPSIIVGVFYSKNAATISAPGVTMFYEANNAHFFYRAESTTGTKWATGTWSFPDGGVGNMCIYY